MIHSHSPTQLLKPFVFDRPVFRPKEFNGVPGVVGPKSEPGRYGPWMHLIPLLFRLPDSAQLV